MDDYSVVILEQYDLKLTPLYISPIIVVLLYKLLYSLFFW